jgi:hypothetical protein
MDNKDLIKQYANTGAVLTAHQIKSLSNNLKNTYYRGRIAAAVHPYGLPFESHEGKLMPNKYRIQYFNHAFKEKKLNPAMLPYLPDECQDDYLKMFTYVFKDGGYLAEKEQFKALSSANKRKYLQYVFDAFYEAKDKSSYKFKKLGQKYFFDAMTPQQKAALVNDKIDRRDRYISAPELNSIRDNDRFLEVYKTLYSMQMTFLGLDFDKKVIVARYKQKAKLYMEGYEEAYAEGDRIKAWHTFTANSQPELIMYLPEEELIPCLQIYFKKHRNFNINGYSTSEDVRFDIIIKEWIKAGKGEAITYAFIQINEVEEVYKEETLKSLSAAHRHIPIHNSIEVRMPNFYKECQKRFRELKKSVT